MARKNKRNAPGQKGEKARENLKWEVAEDLNLDDDLQAGGDELTVKEAGKIGGNVTRRLVEKGKEALSEEKKDK